MPESSTIDAERIASEWRERRERQYQQFNQLIRLLRDITEQLGVLLEDIRGTDTPRIIVNGLRDALPAPEDSAEE